jgi:lambda family phage tail tape measure protein
MAMDMSFAFKIGAQVTGKQAVDGLRSSVDGLNEAANRVSRGFDFARTALAGFIGLQAVQAIVSIGQSLINTADRFDELSQQTGYTVEQLSALDYAAKLSGTSLEAVQSAMGRVAAKAVDAATGNKEAALSFEALGVDIKGADGQMRSSIDIMADVGDALSEITDKTLRTAVAREIFGKSADALIPFLMGMREAQAEAENFGAVISGDLAVSSAEFNDNLDRLTYQLRGMGNQILAELLPPMNTLAESMLDNSKKGGALEVIANGVRIAFEAIVVVGGNLVYIFKQVAAEAVGIARQLEALSRLDFNAFNQIAQQMRKDAALARREIDAWSESIINAKRNSDSAKTSLGELGINIEQVGKNTNTSTAANERAATVIKKLTDGRRQQTEAEKEAIRADKERQSILDGLRDDITKLSTGEEGLIEIRLRRLRATDAEIAQAKELVRERTRIADSNREAERSENERKQTLQGLRDEVQKLIQGEDELTLARLQRLGASAEELKEARELMRQRTQMVVAERELEEAIRQQNEMRDEAKRKTDALADAGKRVYEETRTPAEKLNIELARLNDLLDKGAISWDTYERAQNKAVDEFEGVKEKGKDAMAELTAAVEGWGDQAADAFIEFAFTGKASFKDLVNSILKDIARMLIQQNITKPLFSAISGAFAFAGGGVMTDQGPLPLKTYAKGGIADRPQLAMFGEGRMPEAYVPLPDGRTIPVTMQGGAGGETNVVVNVNMETGQAQPQSDNKKGTDLGLVIASVVKQELINQRRPGGLLAAS